MFLNSKTFVAVTTILSTCLLTGCTNLTGLIDANDQFGCGLPNGVNCSTLTQTYAREARHMDDAATGNVELTADIAHQGNQQGATMHAPACTGQVRTIEPRIAALAHDRRPALHAEPMQLRSRAPENLVMLWILPWVDSEGDLHGQNRVWVRVQDAHWNVERVRTRAMQAGHVAIEP